MSGVALPPIQPVTLERSLGPFDGAAIVISNVIGVGIFTVPGIVAGMVASPVAMLAAWLAGGALAFAGASAYSELAAMRPQAGGEYVYLREGFGPLAAFLTGWTSFVAGFSGAIAAGAVGFAAYLGRYIPAAADAQPFFRVPFFLFTLEVSPRSLVALVLIFTLAAVHFRGLGPGRLLQNALAGLKVLALAVFIAFGFALGSGSTQNFAAAPIDLRPASWLLALVPIMFTYSGWNAAAYLAEEVREPARNVPRALALGTGTVIAIYFLLNLLYLYALPPEKLAGEIRVGDTAAEALFGTRGAHFLTPIILVALASGISAMMMAGPRVYFAMARDGIFLRRAAQVHPRYRTPGVSILAQAAWSGLLVLSGTFEQLLTYTGFAVVLFSGLAVLALLLLRRRHGPPQGYRSWGYPALPLLFIAASLAMVVNAVRESPKPSLAGLALMGIGVPIYWFYWFRQREK